MAAPQLETLRPQVVRIVVESAEGDLSEGDLTVAEGSLSAVSYSSLSYIRMIDTLENELGVFLDPEADDKRFETIDGIVDLVVENMRDAANA